VSKRNRLLTKFTRPKADSQTRGREESRQSSLTIGKHIGSREAHKVIAVHDYADRVVRETEDDEE